MLVYLEQKGPLKSAVEQWVREAQEGRGQREEGKGRKGGKEKGRREPYA